TLDGMKKLVLAFLAVFVVAPTCVAVLLASVLFPAILALRIPVVIVVLALVGSWLGVAALVRLSSHYSRSDDLPPAPRKAAIGLLCGTASALTLMASAGRPFEAPAVLLWGPVVAAAYVGYLLWTSWPKEPENAEMGPLGRFLQSNAWRLQLISIGVVVLLGIVVLILA
ncbi:hypothetical protein, partial [Ramlibacter sp. AN1133]|uniref:hypothetical protein n=1 Tax=Ramlibacter sp. AN1133 TaxID=3133429 RepID=UPI0030C338E8